jgi:hypothetical protein
MPVTGKSTTIVGFHVAVLMLAEPGIVIDNVPALTVKVKPWLVLGRGIGSRDGQRIARRTARVSHADMSAAH